MHLLAVLQYPKELEWGLYVFVQVALHASIWLLEPTSVVLQKPRTISYIGLSYFIFVQFTWLHDVLVPPVFVVEKRWIYVDNRVRNVLLVVDVPYGHIFHTREVFSPIGLHFALFDSRTN